MDQDIGELSSSKGSANFFSRSTGEDPHLIYYTIMILLVHLFL